MVTRNTEQASIEEGSLFPGCLPPTDDALECPDDAYRAMMRTKRAENGLDQSISRRKVISPEIGGAREAQLGRAQVTVDLGLPQRTDLGTFLENDRKVLSFECTWEDKQLCVARRPDSCPSHDSEPMRTASSNVDRIASESPQNSKRNHPPPSLLKTTSHNPPVPRHDPQTPRRPASSRRKRF